MTSLHTCVHQARRPPSQHHPHSATMCVSVNSWKHTLVCMWQCILFKEQPRSCHTRTVQPTPRTGASNARVRNARTELFFAFFGDVDSVARLRLLCLAWVKTPSRCNSMGWDTRVGHFTNIKLAPRQERRNTHVTHAQNIQKADTRRRFISETMVTTVAVEQL
jgi:hypothetical protein